jgi:hypothetical protein
MKMMKKIQLFRLNKQTGNRWWGNSKCGEMGRNGTRTNFNFFSDILLTAPVKKNKPAKERRQNMHNLFMHG